jgi:hypothetical protein
MPNSQAGALLGETAADANVAEAIPARFLDLPAAIQAAHAKGLKGQTIDKAELYWTNGGCGTGNFRIDNAILPRCPPHNFVGVQWRIWSALGETVYVPATS